MTEPRTGRSEVLPTVSARTAAREDQTAKVALASRPATGWNEKRARLESDDSTRGGTA